MDEWPHALALLNVVANTCLEEIGMEYLTTVGLGFDAIGFVLVFLYGHRIFMRFSNRPPTSSEGRNGDLWFEYEGEDAGGNNHQPVYAWLGAGLVVSGFVLQLIGSL